MFGILLRSEIHILLDRSPCGSGTAAIMVNLFQKGLLKIGETFEHESIIGSKFTGKLLREGTTLKGQIRSFIPEISGSAYITGFNNLILSSHDPFPSGFIVSDIWT